MTLAPSESGVADTDQRRWRGADTIALVAVTALAAAIRGVNLSAPPFIYSDEMFYAREACNLVLRAPTTCGIPLDAVSGHPPLGKLLIALGVWAFGWEPVGWRAASLVAGTLSVALLFLLARRTLGTTLGATLAAGLMAIDFLHVVQSRIAMLDVFLALFVTAAAWCAVMSCCVARADGMARGAEHGVDCSPAWLIGAGVAAGGATATKLIGIVAIGVVGGIAIPRMLAVGRGRGGERVRVLMRRQWLTLLVSLVAVPALIYALAYVPILDASLRAPPWAKGSWVRMFASTQREMLRSHLNGAEVKYVGVSNEYVSSAWSWPLLKRPMIYYADSLPGGGHQRVMAMGNPLTWWASFIALGWLGLRLLRGGRPNGAMEAVVGFGAVYLPLVVVSALRGATFIFYMLPGVPFMCLALAVVAERPDVRAKRWLVAAFSLASLALFAFFYPVLTASTLGRAQDGWRIWFHQCTPAPGQLASDGWCWE